MNQHDADQGKQSSQTSTFPAMPDHIVCRNQPRRMFLEAMRRINPNVVSSLPAELFSSFLELLRQYSLSAASFNQLAGMTEMPSPMPEIWGALYEPVVKWGIEKHICGEDDLNRRPTWSPKVSEFPFTDWLVQVVGDTLGGIAAQHTASDSWNLEHVKANYRVDRPAPGPFAPLFAPWDLTEPWSVYTTKVCEALSEKFEAYKDEVDREATWEFNSWGKRCHFDWLVKFQVHRMTWADIASGKRPPEVQPAAPQGGEETSTPKNVRDAVKAVADWMIGPSWRKWLRDSLPGRPSSTH